MEFCSLFFDALSRSCVFDPILPYLLDHIHEVESAVGVNLVKCVLGCVSARKNVVFRWVLFSVFCLKLTSVDFEVLNFLKDLSRSSGDVSVVILKTLN